MGEPLLAPISIPLWLLEAPAVGEFLSPKGLVTLWEDGQGHVNCGEPLFSDWLLSGFSSGFVSGCVFGFSSGFTSGFDSGCSVLFASEFVLSLEGEELSCPPALCTSSFICFKISFWIASSPSKSDCSITAASIPASNFVISSCFLLIEVSILLFSSSADCLYSSKSDFSFFKSFPVSLTFWGAGDS